MVVFVLIFVIFEISENFSIPEATPEQAFSFKGGFFRFGVKLFRSGQEKSKLTDFQKWVGGALPNDRG